MIEPDLQIADYLIALAHAKLTNMDNVKLQNTMLTLNIIHIQQYNKPLFNHQFVKSIYGGMIKDIYDEYQSYGGSNLPIDEPHLTGRNPNQHLQFETTNVNQICQYKKTFISYHVLPILGLDRFVLAQKIIDIPYISQLSTNQTINISKLAQYFKQPQKKFWISTK